MIRNLQLRKSETPLRMEFLIRARRCFQLKMVVAKYSLSGAMPLIRRRWSGPSVMFLEIFRHFLKVAEWNFSVMIENWSGTSRCTVTNTQATIIHVRSGSTFLKWTFLLFLPSHRFTHPRTERKLIAKESVQRKILKTRSTASSSRSCSIFDCDKTA